MPKPIRQAAVNAKPMVVSSQKAAAKGKTALPSKKTPANYAQVLAGLLDDMIDVQQLEDDFIKMVIYGQNRVGKTTLACQFPKPILLIAMEPNVTGGALSVKTVEGVSYLRVGSTVKALVLAKALADNDMTLKGITYKSVIVDSATSYQDIILKELMNLSEVPEMLSWGLVSRDQYRERSEKTREALRPFINLPAHIIINAKERDHAKVEAEKPVIMRREQVESFFAADLGGATVGWLHDACDYIGRLYIEKEVEAFTVKIGNKESTQYRETGKLVRRLRTMYHPNYAAGFRSPYPKCVPEYIQDPSYDKIARIISGLPLK